MLQFETQISPSPIHPPMVRVGSSPSARRVDLAKVSALAVPCPPILLRLKVLAVGCMLYLLFCKWRSTDSKGLARGTPVAEIDSAYDIVLCYTATA